MLRELIEGWVERTERVTEETVLAPSRRRDRRRADGVSTLVVRRRYRVTRDIVCAIGMWRRNRRDPQAGQQQHHHAGTPDPRRTQEHRIQLSDRAVVRQALSDC